MFNYLYKNRILICAYCLANFLCAFVYILYGKELEIVLYPIVISSLVFVMFLMYGFIRYLKHLENIKNFFDNNILFEVKELDERLEIDRIIELNKKVNRLNNLMIKEKEEMIDFYTMWVHQIKIPVFAMKLLLDESSDINLQIELLKIEQYVNMVLNFIRLNDSSGDLLIEEVDVDEIVKNAIKTYSNIFINKHLYIDFKDTNQKVLSDKKWLIFVVEQIVANAVKYTKKGGVTISFENSVLSIKDTGLGIEKSDLSRVFEKGYTGKVGRSEMQSTGLGLYLSKKILDYLNHKITIESRINEGTDVMIDLSSDRHLND